MFRNFPKLLKTLILSVALPVAEFAYKIRIIKNSHKKYKRTSNFNWDKTSKKESTMQSIINERDFTWTLHQGLSEN